MLQYYTSFFMQNIFSLRKFRVTTIGYLQSTCSDRKKRNCYFKRSSQMSQSFQTLSEKSGEEARRGVKLSSSSRNMDLQIARVLSCKFLRSIRKTFRSHRQKCAKSNRKCLFVFRQIETEKLTRNRSVRKSIHTNECRIKTGCLIYKGPADKTVNIQRFEFKLSTILIAYQVSRRQKNEFWGHPFHSVCPLSICLSCLIEPTGANTDTAILSSSYFQIFLHSHNSQWQPGGGRQHIRFRLPLFPRHWHLSQGSNFHFCLMFDSPRYLQYKCSNCLFWQSLERDRLRVCLIERQNTGIAARNKILDLSVWDLQEKDDSDEGGKLGIVHSPASQIIAGSSLSGMKSRKKHSPRRREVWWEAEGEDQGPCVNMSDAVMSGVWCWKSKSPSDKLQSCLPWESNL